MYHLFQLILGTVIFAIILALLLLALVAYWVGKNSPKQW